MQITEFRRLQFNKKDLFWPLYLLRNRRNGGNGNEPKFGGWKRPEKSIGRGTGNDTLAQKVEMWFLESRWNTKGQTSEIRVVEKPQKEPKNLKKCNLAEPSLKIL